MKMKQSNIMNYTSLQTISRWFILYIFCVHVYELTHPPASHVLRKALRASSSSSFTNRSLNLDRYCINTTTVRFDYMQTVDTILY